MRNPDPISQEVEELARQSVDAAFRIHSRLGPGLLESVYSTCMCIELRARNIPVLSEVQLPVIYEGYEFESAYRIDLLVNNELIIEVKAGSVKQLPLHKSQLLTYLKLARKRLGLLINFNVPYIKEGIHRMAL